MPTAAPPQETEALVPFSTRIRASTLREAKVHATLTDQKMQDVVEQALREYLARHSQR